MWTARPAGRGRRARPIAGHDLRVNLQVELEGPFRGRTIGDRSRLQDPDKHTQVALGVDVPEFLDRFMGRVTAAAR